MTKIKPAAEAVTVLHKRMQIITPILPSQRVEMRSKEGTKFTPEYIFTDVTVFRDGLVQIEALYAYGEVGERTLRTDYIYSWNSATHLGWEDKPPALLTEHADAVRARDWSTVS